MYLANKKHAIGTQSNVPCLRKDNFVKLASKSENLEITREFLNYRDFKNFLIIYTLLTIFLDFPNYHT